MTKRIEKEEPKTLVSARYLPRPEMINLEITAKSDIMDRIQAYDKSRRLCAPTTSIMETPLKDVVISEYEARILQSERIISDVINHSEGVRNAIQKENEKDKLVLTALKFLGCGCDLCLNHNNWKCPKIKEEEVK